MLNLIGSGEQAAQCVARGLAFAYRLRERQENASVKQLLIAAGMVPAEIGDADWSQNFAQLIQPRLRYLLNSMVAAEKIASGSPTDLLSRIVHAKTGQTTRVHRRLVEADLEVEVDRRIQMALSDRAKQAQAARTPQARRLSAIKANESRTPEQRSDAARKAWAKRKDEAFEG